MRWWTALTVGFILVGAACTDSSDSTSPDDDGGAEPTATTTTTAPESPSESRPAADLVACAPVDDGGEVVVGGPWAVGDRVTYDYWTKRAQAQPFEQTLDIVVESIEADSSVLRLEPGPADLGLVDGAPPELVDALDQATTTPVVYRTDEFGSFSEVLNVDELEAAAASVADAYRMLPGVDESLIDTATSEIRPESNRYVQLIQLIHFPVGLTLTDEPIVVDGSVSNPLGGDPLAATETLGLESANGEGGCVEFAYTIEPTPDALAGLMDEIVEKTPAGLPNQIEEVDMSTVNSYAVDARTGWPHRVETAREITVDRVSQIDESSLVLVG